MKKFIEKREQFEEKFNSLKDEIMFALYGSYGDDDEPESYAQYYRYEMDGMKEDVGEYIIAMLKVNLKPTALDIAKSIIYTEHMHIGNDDAVIENINMEKLEKIAKQLMPE